MQKTALQKLKDHGVPDVVLAALILLLASIVLAPFLGGQHIAGFTVPTIPHATYVAFPSLVALVALLLPLFADGPLRVEISHRISWIERHLDSSPLEVKKAYEADHALAGVGAFHVTDHRFSNIDLEGLLSRLGKANTSRRRFKESVGKLSSVLGELPPSCGPAERVELKLAKRIQDAKRDFMLAADSAKLIR